VQRLQDLFKKFRLSDVTPNHAYDVGQTWFRILKQTRPVVTFFYKMLKSSVLADSTREDYSLLVRYTIQYATN